MSYIRGVAPMAFAIASAPEIKTFSPSTKFILSSLGTTTINLSGVIN